jgi:hypothetical protein
MKPGSEAGAAKRAAFTDSLRTQKPITTSADGLEASGLRPKTALHVEWNAVIFLGYAGVTQWLEC